MDKRKPFEQLDDAVQAILSHSTAALPQVEDEVEALVRLAGELRHLPSPEFKVKLKNQLEEKTMSTATSNPARTGFHTITPYLQVRQADELVGFIKKAFAGEETFRGGPGSEGGMHCEMRIGDSMLMIGGGPQWRGAPKPTAIHLYVSDADSLYHRAVEAGATVLNPLTNQSYGDREGCVQDPFGNHWYIATNAATGAAPAGLRTVTLSLHPKGAESVIAFLRQAFEAEEVFRAASPQGVIQHAQLRIGDSMLEIGEAHGQYQPMPSAIFLYLPDARASYEKALQAGATSVWAPAEMYGDLMAGISDPFGNDWYLATHLESVAPTGR
jgi:PhnB protein